MNKKILLGITGGIAAYKCPELVRQLKKSGFEVRVVLTQNAAQFVSPLSLQVVSENKVHDNLFDADAELAMGHIDLAKWADLILIAPATANCIAKLAHGMADDLLSTLCLASPAKIAIAPAMNQQMYHAKITQSNLQILKNNDFLIWGPATGEQACKDIGLGRMLEPANILSQVQQLFCVKPNCNLNIVITAGPTQEEIDPVRYITNYSSGKMGYAIAKAAAKMGAKVTLISGPVTLIAPDNVCCIPVRTAIEMHQKALNYAKKADVFIACAAVADFRAKETAIHKIKKQHETEFTLTLVKNPDIVADVANLVEDRPYVVGFAAETQNLKQNALLKLQQKNLDMICANDVSKSNQGFNADNNSLIIYTKEDEISFSLADKEIIAQKLITTILKKVSH